MCILCVCVNYSSLLRIATAAPASTMPASPSTDHAIRSDVSPVFGALELLLSALAAVVPVLVFVAAAVLLLLGVSTVVPPLVVLLSVGVVVVVFTVL